MLSRAGKERGTGVAYALLRGECAAASSIRVRAAAASVLDGLQAAVGIGAVRVA